MNKWQEHSDAQTLPESSGMKTFQWCQILNVRSLPDTEMWKDYFKLSSVFHDNSLEFLDKLVYSSFSELCIHKICGIWYRRDNKDSCWAQNERKRKWMIWDNEKGFGQNRIKFHLFFLSICLYIEVQLSNRNDNKHKKIVSVRLQACQRFKKIFFLLFMIEGYFSENQPISENVQLGMDIFLLNFISERS